jgi:hypothetical protein
MWKLKLMWVMWPAFLAAGVLEMLVFAVIDPEDMRWMGQSLAWPRQAVYSRSSESVNLAGEAVKREEVR